ncbi:hypothetical protein FKP32DRAFT_897234 [Trametes sanguinea]|nr:hypothetical protein FKP32DRAFT_897234 [Trametes sanguinea]
MSQQDPYSYSSARIPVIVSDLLVAVITWVKTFKDYQLSSKVTTRPTLHSVMLGHGILYFVLLLCLNLLQVVFHKLSLDPIIPGTESQISSYITLFLDPLTSILISHFILNLRAANDPSSTSINSSFVDGELQFAQRQELVNSLDGPVHTLSSMHSHSQSAGQIEMEEMGTVEERPEEEVAEEEA